MEPLATDPDFVFSRSHLKKINLYRQVNICFVYAASGGVLFLDQVGYVKFKDDNNFLTHNGKMLQMVSRSAVATDKYAMRHI